jgi:hypothetical protein
MAFSRRCPPLHIVEYAGDTWLQSEPLLLVNTAGKMAIGYCQQEPGECHRFEVGPSGEAPGEISLWASVHIPSREDVGLPILNHKER